MNKTRGTKILLIVMLLAMLIMVKETSALTILQSHPFSVQSTPVGMDFLAVQPFDAALGQLDIVAVTITGQVVAQALAPPNPSPPPNPIPIPYPLLVQVEQSFFGLGGRFFAFETPGQFLFLGTATGVSETVVFGRFFSYTFKFDEQSDVAGIVVPDVDGVDIPPIIYGRRADFLKTLVPLNEIDLFQQAVATSGGPALQGLQARAEGVMIIQYDYTPAPLPGAIWLMGSGLLGLAGWVRSRQTM